jgi:hypothetical protein
MFQYVPSSSGKTEQKGFSLVELLVGSLIAIIVFVGWLHISNFQAIRKESLRRMGIEKASGYLEVMVERSLTAGQHYSVIWTNNAYAVVECDDQVQPLFESSQPIGYCLKATTSVTDEVNHTGDWTAGKWVVISLYDMSGVAESEAGRPFSKMSLKVE